MEEMLSRPFRTLADFGKRIEYWIAGRVLKEGLDVDLPLVDDDAVDAQVRRPDGSVALVQAKARSADVIPDDAALFAAIDGPEERTDYWLVSYSERMDTMWSTYGISRVRLPASPGFVAPAGKEKRTRTS